MKVHKQSLLKWILVLISFTLTHFSRASNLAMVSGKVTSDTKEIISYATVHLKGTTLGSMTDDNGNYTIQAPAGSYTLVVSMMGYSTVEQSVILINEENTTLNITDRKSVV